MYSLMHVQTVPELDAAGQPRHPYVVGVVQIVVSWQLSDSRSRGCGSTHDRAGTSAAWKSVHPVRDVQTMSEVGAGHMTLWADP